MVEPSEDEPPDRIWYELEEALSLLADLEDARDALIQSRQLAVLVGLERQIRELSRKLHFDV
jgi:hypothetical protein